MDGRWPGRPPIHDSSRVAERRKGIEEWVGAQSFSPAARGRGSGRTPRSCPKPLLPVGDRAILDVVVHQLRDAGFDDLTLAVGYLSHLVRAVMGDGSTHGVSIDYHEELEPLGTVGPLATIDRLDDTFLMMNGDVLTALDYAHLVDVHRESGNVLTIASHRRVVRTEYGVIHLDGNAGETRVVTGFEEKPELPVHREHGRLRARARGARARRGQSAPGPAGPRHAPARRRTSRWAPTSTTATGSTSDATRTTRRRSSSSSRSSPS